VHLTVRATRHGPVISDIDPELAAAVGKDKAVALSFIGLDADDTTVQAFRQMDRARDWPSFQAALKLWSSPEQNIVYADIDGHIGFTAVGTLPIRKRQTDDFPAPGADGAADWIGFSDFSQLPQAADPPGHRFINANNRVAPADYPLYITRDYEGESWRAQRIADMLDGHTGLTADDFSHMQADAKAQDAVAFLPRLLAAKPRSEIGAKAIALLAGWDGAMDRRRPEPLIYAAWRVRLKRDLLSGRAKGVEGTAEAITSSGALLRLLDDPAVVTPDEAQALAGAALDEAAEALAQAYGGDPGSWRWGDAHKAALTSQLFGRIPVLGGLFDVGLPADGGSETVNRGGYGRSDGVSFPDIHGPGFRGVYDLANLDQSRFVIASGESGNPLSPHYGDFAERWRDGGWTTLAGTLEEVAAQGHGALHFSP
jgi:penicillin amidase